MFQDLGLSRLSLGVQVLSNHVPESQVLRYWVIHGSYHIGHDTDTLGPKLYDNDVDVLGLFRV